MDHTASIERPFLTSSMPMSLRNVLAEVTTATWLLTAQAACYIMRMNVGYASRLSDVVISVGMLAAVAGIYHGLRWSRKGNARRGSNCAAVSMLALLFWTAQLFVSQMPLFK